jgi:hypothetical protein
MRCQAADETVLHCLRDCGATMSIWSKVSLNNMSGFWCNNPTDWVMVFYSFPDVHLFLCTFWWIASEKHYLIWESL